ncbi:hypothetical protein EVAR_78871_1 [Eumeta japonica]|uniref:Uncharacterized protein n=1 Tax=Eumeta variegata TaxID=151549 RepID=A0A4C1U361_EUMVA|nr:hypothetical protein EVAR_78871_1 [Eumeta japonica]
MCVGLEDSGAATNHESLQLLLCTTTEVANGRTNGISAQTRHHSRDQSSKRKRTKPGIAMVQDKTRFTVIFKEFVINFQQTMAMYQSLFTVKQFSKITIPTSPVSLKKRSNHILRGTSLARYLVCFRLISIDPYGRPNLMVGHMPVFFGHRALSISIFIVHGGGVDGRPSRKSSLRLTTLKLRKPVLNGHLAWCFIAKSSSSRERLC